MHAGVAQALALGFIARPHLRENLSSKASDARGRQHCFGRRRNYSESAATTGRRSPTSAAPTRRACPLPYSPGRQRSRARNPDTSIPATTAAAAASNATPSGRRK